MTSKRGVAVGLPLLVVLGCLASSLAAQGPAGPPTVGNHILTGPARLTAVLPSLSPSTKAADGILSLGDVALSNTKRSSGAFTSRQGERYPFDASKLIQASSALQKNEPPVANAGPDQTVTTGSVVSLNASASSDVDGDPLTYAWALLSRPAGSAAALSNPAVVNPTFAADRPGDYVVQLVVNDGFVNSAPDTVTISTSNSPPVANAGPDQTIATGSVVSLNASASSDVDGNPLTYAWALLSRPADSAAALSNPAVVNPTFVADRPGAYVVQLVVNDGFVNSAPDTVTISTSNSPPMANAGPDQADVPAGATVHLNGSGSSDTDGDPLTYAWALLSRPADSAAALSDPAVVNPTFVADRPGAYVVQLVVNDGFVNSAPDTALIGVAGAADIALSKAVQTATPTVGQHVAFRVTVKNNGPGNASGVQVTDLLPSGYAHVMSVASRGTYNRTTGVWTVGTVNNGAAVTLTITARVLATGNYSNTATRTASAPADPNAANDSATAVVTPIETADIALSKTVQTATPTVGQHVAFRVTVKNNGPGNASGVQVTDLLPSGYAHVMSVASRGLYNRTTGVWTVGTVSNGAAATLTITARVLATGGYRNTATRTASAPADPNAANDSAAAVVTPIETADIALSKTVHTATPALGQHVAFRVTVKNNGPGNASGVQVTDLLPSGYAYVMSVASRGLYNRTTGVWTVGTVSNGAAATLTITARVLATGSYCNTATRTASSPADPNAANDSATAVVTPIGTAAIALSEAVHTATPTMGKEVALPATVRNILRVATAGDAPRPSK